METSHTLETQLQWTSGKVQPDIEERAGKGLAGHQVVLDGRFELVYGRPTGQIAGEDSIVTRNAYLQQYVQSLSQILFTLHWYSVDLQPAGLNSPAHLFKAGDSMLVRMNKDESLQPSRRIKKLFCSQHRQP